MCEGGIKLVSIIYDALQKIQKNRSNKIVPQKHSPKKSNFGKSIVISLASLCAAAIFINNAYMLGYFSAPSSKNAAKTKYVLNGVFLSDQLKLAMINNKSFHLGDTIGDMKITSIDPYTVELQNEKQSLVLRTEV